MIQLFLTLTFLNWICLALATGIGYLWGGTPMGHWHLLAGSLAAITCCAVHCVVFTYFIATAKWIQHAVMVKRLDPAFNAPTRSFKMQAFPSALLAMAVVLLAAFSGAAADNYYIPGLWHHVLAWVAVAVNVIVAWFEYTAIVRNGRLIDRVLDAINTSSETTSAADNTRTS